MGETIYQLVQDFFHQQYAVEFLMGNENPQSSETPNGSWGAGNGMWCLSAPNRSERPKKCGNNALIRC